MLCSSLLMLTLEELLMQAVENGGLWEFCDVHECFGMNLLLLLFLESRRGGSG